MFVVKSILIKCKVSWSWLHCGNILHTYEIIFGGGLEAVSKNNNNSHINDLQKLKIGIFN